MRMLGLGVIGASILMIVLSFVDAGDAVAQEPNAERSLAGFRLVDVEAGASSSQRLIDLFLPYIGNHPEALDGRPTMTLDLRRVGDMIVVDLEMGGYLDDSVAGEHWRGLAVEGGDGWTLIAMGVKANLLARAAE